MADIEVSCDLQNKKNINASFSDVLGINLQKEIKMGIELNAPLYIGADTNLQQQVTQNTADIADLKQDVSDIEADIGNLNDLDTVDKSSVVNAINEALSVLDPTQTADYINNSKGLKSGEVSTNSVILNDIKEYAHSTFDLSKFTVVGSPNITDDGIVSGFSSSNYLGNITVNKSSGDEFVFNIKYTHKHQETSQGLISAHSTAINFFMYCVVNNSDKIASAINNLGYTQSSITLVDGQTYNIQYKTNFKDYFKVYVDGVLTINVSIDEQNVTIDYICLGRTMSTQYNTGTFDLKQFSITVDGVEVFSGNKTGIDTIKPDDYTVVGSPTITDDGFVSGFNDSNYITTPDLSFGSSVWEITDSFVFNTSANNQALVSGITQASAPLVYVSATGMQLHIPSAPGTWGWQLLNAFHTFTVGNIYYYKTGWDGTSYYIKISDDLGKTYSTLQTLSGTVMLGGSGTFKLAIGANPSNASRYVTGSIDLNAFKIYVDGNLVYQPCLKIPYTESKTGSKIVDSVYRDRVNDMAEQLGFANYYTLDEDNGNFSLPQVELYGLIGQKTLRYSYEYGINKVELYSNRDLTQQGSCTSGVEVTFMRPFADTNYILTVPYSAKSATAFTPTQTGDWKAEGKGWF